jgi:hypothetical protein
LFFEESIVSAFILSYRVSSTQRSAFIFTLGPAISTSNLVITAFNAAKFVSFYQCSAKFSTFDEPYN